MPLSLTTLSLVASLVSLQEGVKILERDNYCCRYCGLDGRASFENALVMSVDFVVPRARKGKKDPQNLVACCRPCNAIKGTRVYANIDEARACSRSAMSYAKFGNPKPLGQSPGPRTHKTPANRSTHGGL